MDDFLTAVEIGCVALLLLRDKAPEARGTEQRLEESITEINERFEQHAVGYQFENGRIIRVDSKFAHAEIMKPALQLLIAPMFAKANEEFLGAHKHYRAGAFKDCVTAANRAFESMLKAICDTEKWTYSKGDRAPELITKVTNNGLFTHQFCPTNKPNRRMPHGRMSMELYAKIVRELAAGGYKGIVMFGLFAEPFEDRFLIERVASPA